MTDNREDALLLICQCMKTVLTRQEKILTFSRAALAALKKRQPLVRDDTEELRILQADLDDAQTLEDIHELVRKLDETVLALKDPQKKS